MRPLSELLPNRQRPDFTIRFRSRREQFSSGSGASLAARTATWATAVASTTVAEDFMVAGRETHFPTGPTGENGFGLTSVNN